MKTVLLAAISIAAVVNAAPQRPERSERPGRPTPVRGTAPPWYTTRTSGGDDWPPWLTLGVPGVITILPTPQIPGVLTIVPPGPYCGVDAFQGHTLEASSFCSSFLGNGPPTTVTDTITRLETRTTRVTSWYTLPFPTPSVPTIPTLNPFPSFTPPSFGPYPSSTPAPPPPPPPSSTPGPSSSAAPPPPPPPASSTIVTVSSSVPAPPAASTSAGCGLVGYTKTTSAYNFDGSGTKNTFTLCKASCLADSQCKSFGYGQTDCLLFNVLADDNVNYNPMSPYTFYDKDCPVELPVFRKRSLSPNRGYLRHNPNLVAINPPPLFEAEADAEVEPLPPSLHPRGLLRHNPNLVAVNPPQPEDLHPRGLLTHNPNLVAVNPPQPEDLHPRALLTHNPNLVAVNPPQPIEASPLPLPPSLHPRGLLRHNPNLVAVNPPQPQNLPRDIIITQLAPAPEASQAAGQVVTINAVTDNAGLSSACTCVITSAPQASTVHVTVTTESVRSTRTIVTTLTITPVGRGVAAAQVTG